MCCQYNVGMRLRFEICVLRCITVHLQAGDDGLNGKDGLLAYVSDSAAFTKCFTHRRVFVCVFLATRSFVTCQTISS